MSDLKDLIELLTITQDKALLEDFLLGLTTEKERREFGQRIEIVRRILAGEPHQKIAADLGVGVATVTRGSKELSQGRFKIMRSEYNAQIAS